MCFSAEASFVVAAGIGACGGLALKKAANLPERIFAAIPLIFAAQQLTEGLLWISLENNANPETISRLSRVYLAFAWIIWPFYLPWSIRLLETKRKLKQLQSIILLLGVLVATGLAYALFFLPLQTSINEHHLSYRVPVATLNSWLIGVLYFIPVVLPLFTSSRPMLRWLGIVSLMSFLAASYFYRAQLISVWCFFAAIVSMAILFILYRWHVSSDETGRAESL